jgi:hypothetical protein
MVGNQTHQSTNPLLHHSTPLLGRLNNRCIIYEKPFQSSRVTASKAWKKPPPRFQGLEKSGRKFPVFGKTLWNTNRSGQGMR